MENNDPIGSYSSFDNLFSECFENSFPITKVEIKYNNKLNWLTEGLRTSIKFKNKLYKISITNPSENHIKKYKTYKNKLNKLLKIAERTHYREKIKKKS